MTKKEPLYPHIPKRRMATTTPRDNREEVKIRFLPDSPEVLTQSMNGVGIHAKLERAFLQAISRARAKS